ncbi:MAG: PAS domain S-box protein [Candidatus Omnitrophota bacterium]
MLNKTKEELIKEIRLLKSRIAAMDIDSKKSEGIIQKACEYAESIVETLREPLMVLDENLKVISANHSFYSTFKVNSKETEGQFIYDLGNRQWDIPALRKLLEEILPKNKFFNGYKIEHNFETVGQKTMLLNARRLDNVQMILLAIEDITDRDKMDKELRKSEIKFKSLVENIPDRIFIKNKDLVYTYCSENYGNSLKMKPEEIIGKTDFDIFSKKLAEKYRSDDKRIMKTGVPEEIEEKYTESGKERWAHTVKAPYRNGADKIIGVIGVFRDITAYKQAQEALLKSGEYFKQIFNFSPDGIVISSADEGKFIRLNEAILFMFGYSREEAIGRTARELNVWGNPNDRDILVKSLIKQKVVQRAEVMLRRKSGELFYASISLSLIEFGGKRCLITAVRDITERKKMEEELKKVRSELEEEKKLLIDKNIAFQEVIKEIEVEKNALKDDVIANVNDIILPILKRIRLKNGGAHKYLNLVEKNLGVLTSSFGRRMTEKTFKLTPKEIEIVGMIKLGLATKEISSLLNVSSQTIDKHRKNIRKKLGLSTKNINLTSFLQSL